MSDFKEQLEELTKRFDGYGEQIDNVVGQAILTGSIAIADKYREHVPKDTGHLAQSISASPLKKDEDDAIYSEAGSNLVYAAPVEFGSAPHETNQGSEDFVASVTLWGQRKGMSENQILELIEHIRQYGTKPHPALYPAYYELIGGIKQNIKGAIDAVS